MPLMLAEHEFPFICCLLVLRMLGGKPLPKEWAGETLKNISVGPGFHLSTEGKEVLLEVHNSLKQHTVNNVIGKIRGHVEPGNKY